MGREGPQPSALPQAGPSHPGDGGLSLSSRPRSPQVGSAPRCGCLFPAFSGSQREVSLSGSLDATERARMLHSVRKAQGSCRGGGGSPPAQGRPSSVQSQPHSPDTEGHRSDTMALGFPGLAPATVTGPARKLVLTWGRAGSGETRMRSR